VARNPAGERFNIEILSKSLFSEALHLNASVNMFE